MKKFKLSKTMMAIALIPLLTLTACGGEAKQENIENDSDIAAIEAAVKEGEQEQNKNQKRYEEAVSAYESGDMEGAKKSLKSLIEEEPENALYAYAYGNVFLKEKDYESARAQYDRTIELEPSLIEAYNNAAGICMLDGDLEKAQGYVQRALEIKPEDSELLFKSGQLYFATGKYEQSIETLEKIALEDMNFEVHRFLGLDRAYTGDDTNAMKEFEEYLKLAPKELPVRANIESMYETLKAGGHLTPPEIK